MTIKKRAPRARRRPTGSIFKKMLWGYVLLTLLIVMLTGAFSTLFVRIYTLNNTRTELLDKAQVVAEMIAKPGGKTRVLNSVQRLTEIEKLTDARFVYVDPSMNAQFIRSSAVLALLDEDEDVQTSSIIDALDVELVKTILAGEARSDVQQLEFIDAEVVYAGAPVVDYQGYVTGAVILSRPVTAVSNRVFSIAGIQTVAGGIALVIAIALAWALSRALSRPLTQLKISAERVADGHYGEKVDTRDDDEIGQLGMTLNLLSVRLKDVIETLRDEKSKLEQILTGIAEGIVAIDKEGRVIHLNPAALKLMELTEWRKNLRDEAISRQQELIEMLTEAMNRGEPMETVFKNDSGMSIHILAAPIMSEESEALGAVALLRDISEAERLEQMRRDYIANISHELRTPLTGIRGMTEPLLDGLMETERERMDSYAVIYQETLRLEKLIGEMLDVSRLQEGRVEIDMEPMEPEGLMEAASRRVAARAKEAGIDLVLDVQRPDIHFMGNEDRIIQVLTIFLDNAVSFTPSGGEIRIFVRSEGKHIIFGVKDNGAGIDAQDLPYIWERFYKADKARMGTTGTGLGLAIAKLVAERMGGQVAVESEVGAGSTFTFILPTAGLEGE